MTHGKILYTDGHQVTVTDSIFRVNKNFYRLDGIIRHSLIVIPPNRLLVVICLSLGLIFLALGIFNTVPAGWIQHLEVRDTFISTRILSMGFGAALLMTGIGFLVVMKEKYGVHIITAEGEKEVVVSPQKEYVAMIDEALNKALQRW